MRYGEGTHSGMSGVTSTVSRVDMRPRVKPVLVTVHELCGMITHAPSLMVGGVNSAFSRRATPDARRQLKLKLKLKRSVTSVYEVESRRYR